jgi:death on curing protein
VERISKSLNFLSKEMIIEINREMINRYGGMFRGKDNLKYPESLDWVLDAIQYPIFGIDHYPTLVRKAAQLGWIINEGHVFHDGNKRTSNMSVLLFLVANDFVIKTKTEDFIEISEKIATCKICGFTIEDYVFWLEGHLMPV